MRPTPILHLHCPQVTISRGMGWKREEQEVDLPLARVLFDYAGAEVGWQDGRTEINHVKDNRLLVLPRDTLFEVQIDRAAERAGPAAPGPDRPRPVRARELPPGLHLRGGRGRRRLDALGRVQPPGPAQARAAKAGASPSARTIPIRWSQADDAWKVDVNDSGIDWFDLDLGIEVDGERVALLPILLDLFERAPEELSPAALDEFGEDHVFGTLPDGRLLPIPAARLKAMLEALYELFASRRDRRRRQAAPVAGRDDPAHGDRDRAAERGPALDRRRGAARHGAAPRPPPARSRPSPPPKGLKATLRHYQEDGFAWLQFLERPGAVRRARRRHGPGQDRAGAGPHPGREGSRPARSSPA